MKKLQIGDRRKFSLKEGRKELRKERETQAQRWVVCEGANGKLQDC